MVAKDRSEEIVRESVDRVKLMAQNIGVAIHPMGGATIDSLEQCRREIYAAADRAVDHGQRLIRERG